MSILQGASISPLRGTPSQIEIAVCAIIRDIRAGQSLNRFIQQVPRPPLPAADLARHGEAPLAHLALEASDLHVEVRGCAVRRIMRGQ